MKEGTYVLATKFGDGDPQDHWAIGYYKGNMPAAIVQPRHDVVDNDGKSFRANGFRRVGRLEPEMGAWLLERSRAIEQSGKSLWQWRWLYRKHGLAGLPDLPRNTQC